MDRATHVKTVRALSVALAIILVAALAILGWMAVLIARGGVAEDHRNDAVLVMSGGAS